MSFTTHDLQEVFDALDAVFRIERDRLCTLDGAIGDADHGIAMEQGMTAAAMAVGTLGETTLQAQFHSAAKAFLGAVGASTGPLYATAFMSAGKRLGATTAIERDDLRGAIIAMTEGIADRGKAQPGQKTMLDAWHPAAVAARAGKDAAAIVVAAEAGADATRDMVATLGRAARLGARSLGHPDPGAVSAAMIVKVLCARM